MEYEKVYSYWKSISISNLNVSSVFCFGLMNVNRTWLNTQCCQYILSSIVWATRSLPWAFYSTNEGGEKTMENIFVQFIYFSFFLALQAFEQYSLRIQNYPPHQTKMSLICLQTHPREIKNTHAHTQKQNNSSELESIALLSTIRHVFCTA